MFAGQDNNVWLGANCFQWSVIIHEVGHRLGLYHEHQRPDRDNYLVAPKRELLPIVLLCPFSLYSCASPPPVPSHSGRGLPACNADAVKSPLFLCPIPATATLFRGVLDWKGGEGVLFFNFCYAEEQIQFKSAQYVNPYPLEDHNHFSKQVVSLPFFVWKEEPFFFSK